MQPSDPSNARRQRRCPGDLDQAVRSFVAGLTRRYAEELARDPKDFRRRVLRVVGAGLRTRGPGRPGLQEVTAALAMREQGKAWPEVYRACIPDYAALDPSIRRWRQRDLRDRVRSRRYQQRKRRERPGSYTELVR